MPQNPIRIIKAPILSSRVLGPLEDRVGIKHESHPETSMPGDSSAAAGTAASVIATVGKILGGLGSRAQGV